MCTKTISTALLVFTVVTLLVVLAFRVRVGATAEANRHSQIAAAEYR